MTSTSVSRGATCSVSDVVRAVAALAPPHLAEAWDNVGLQVGHPGAPARRVMTCLELTAPVLAEAQRRGADVLVAHHPLIFQPLKALNLAQPTGELVAELLTNKMALVAAHTNLDAAAWSTNTQLAELLDLKVDTRLAGREGEVLYKFIVFVPVGHEQAVIDAIAAGGGGRIGQYTHCTFRAAGTGTFRGALGTNPFIGEADKLEQAEEYRIESIVPAAARERVYNAVRAVHPYEEMAGDWIALSGLGQPLGIGVVTRPAGDGKGAAALTLGELIARCKAKLGVEQVRLAGPEKTKLKKIAICTGSGGSFLGMAAARADAYVTGEINYHHAVEAHARKLPVIELGHFESEVLIAEPLAAKLAQDEKLKAAGVEIIAAKKDLQPFRWS